MVVKKLGRWTVRRSPVRTVKLLAWVAASELAENSGRVLKGA